MTNSWNIKNIGKKIQKKLNQKISKRGESVRMDSYMSQEVNDEEIN